MKKSFYFIVFCLIPFVSHSSEISREKIEAFLNQEKVENHLGDATYRYLDFIDSLAHGEYIPDGLAATLLDQDCKKIFNGSLYTSTRDAFVSDLVTVNKTQGCWNVYPADIIISPKSSTSILRLIIEMETSETFTAIVILRFNEKFLITEINEVFNRMGNPYNFESEDI